MKKELLEYIVRECVKAVLEASPQDPETIGAPAPPEAGQGTADQPPIPSPEQPPITPQRVDIRGIWYLDPRKPGKPVQLKLAAKDPAGIERELYRTASKSGGPRLKVASATLREVPKTLSNPNTALFLYIGKQNEDDPDTELFLLPAKTLQQAQAGSVQPGVSAEHPPTAIPEPSTSNIPPPSGPSIAQKTMAPDIDENTKLRNMLSTMIKEALSEIKVDD